MASLMDFSRGNDSSGGLYPRSSGGSASSSSSPADNGNGGNTGDTYGGYIPPVTQAPSFNITPQQAQTQQSQLDAVNPLLQQRMNEQLQQNNTDPFMGSLQRMQEGNYGPDDPSYQWRLQQGQKSAERSLASRGLLGSGNAAVELLQFGQGMASTEFANQWNRLLTGSTGYQNMLTGSTSRLASLAGVDLGQRQLSASNSQFNAGQANSVNMFNTGQTNQMNLEGARYGLEAWGKQNSLGIQAAQVGMQAWSQANANSIQQQRLALDQTRQQTAAMAGGMDYQGQAYWDQQQREYKSNQGAASARAAFNSGGSGQISQNSVSKNYNMESFGVNTSPSFGTPQQGNSYWGSVGYAQGSNDLGGGSAYGLGSYEQSGNSYGDGTGFSDGGGE